MDVNIVIQHGGIIVKSEGEYVYKGGIAEKEMGFDEEKISMLHLYWAIWELGYQNCGPLYVRCKADGKLKRLVKHADLEAYLAASGGGDKMIIYVDCPYNQISQWERVREGELGVHKERGTIFKVGDMCIPREPKEESRVSKTVTEGTKYLGEGVEVRDLNEGDGEQEVDLQTVEVGEELIYEKSESESSDGLDEELEDSEASDVEATNLLEEKRKHREERKRGKADVNKKTSVELGPVGADKGFESYLKSGNSYDGLLAGGNEYIGSDDEDSLPSVDEEDDDFEEAVAEHRRRIKTRVYYDPNCTEPLWELGMIFKNAEQFRDAVIYYAVKRGVHIKYKRNDSRRVRVTCAYVDKKDQTECPWLLYASTDKRSGNFIIKNYKPIHHCLKQHTNRHCDSKFIAKFLREDIIKTPNIKPWVMQETLRMKLSVYKGKSVCRRARELVVNEINGDYTEEFRRLYDYRDLILRTNPGSTCVVEVDKVGEHKVHVFKQMYVCFNALKKGFMNGCRHFLGFDGCFLKGAFKGQLLVAVGRNGNNEIYPVAWAVVHTETTESWTWFLDLVSKDLCLGRGKGYALVTDMQKGLENAIVAVLPEAEHRECARHIIANWAKKWGGEEKRKAFWRCAKSTFQMQLKENLDKLKELGGDEILDDLLRYNIERWCRYYIKEDTKCDSIDNNVSESFNSLILAARHKSILSMLEEIRIEMVKRHAKFKDFTDKWHTDISPMAYKILEEHNERSMQCSILWNADDGYEVKDGDWKHVVNLKENTCTCRIWMLKGIPCPHAISAMHSSSLDPVDFVSHWYHKDTYKKAYTHFIQPMTNMKMVAESSNPPIEAPPVKPQPGRPKKKRNKPKDELKKIGKLSQKGMVMTCSYCKEENHNITTCPLKKAGKPPKTKEPVAESSKRSKKRAPANADVVKPNKKASKGATRTCGYGVYISEKTGFTVEQNGRPECNRVITTGRGTILKDASVVTGDLGFTPKTRKWKGKQVVTQSDLVATQAKQQMSLRSQPKPAKVTETQKKRAETNRKIAVKKLAARGIGSSQPVLNQPSTRATRSDSVQKSCSQPNPAPAWKL